MRPFQAPLPFTEPDLDLAAAGEIQDDVVVAMPETSAPGVEVTPSEEIDEALA